MQKQEQFSGGQRKQAFTFGWVIPLSYTGKLLPSCLKDLMPTWDLTFTWECQQSFSVYSFTATPGKTSQCTTIRGAGVLAAHECVAAWPEGCGKKLHPFGKEACHLQKATATANTRECRSHIHFLTEDPLCAGRRLWAASAYLFCTKEGRKTSEWSMWGGSNSLEKYTAVGMLAENW